MGGTLLAARGLTDLNSPLSVTAAHAGTVAMVKDVAKGLGNTPAVCRKSYIHPAVLSAYEDREALDRWCHARGAARAKRGLTIEESALLGFLRGLKLRAAEEDS